MKEEDENKKNVEVSGVSGASTPEPGEPGDELRPACADTADGELTEKIVLLEKERDEYLNGWRRTKADLANYRNEELARLEEVVKFGNSDLVKELIPVFQNFDRAISALGDDGASKGIMMIKSQLGEIMKRRGLTELGVKAGDMYDPARGEILSEDESEKPPGMILEVVQKGYVLHGKIICPAQVKVSKGQILTNNK